MMNTFGQRLKSLRREAGYSQSDLSDRIGISVQSISKWENDNTMPDISQIVPLASVLGVSTDWLLGVGMNEDIDLQEMAQHSSTIYHTHSLNSYAGNAYLIVYELERDFLKKYPLNYAVRIEGAKNLLAFIKKSKEGFFSIPEKQLEDLVISGIKMIRPVTTQDNDPSRQIEGRLLLIRFLDLDGEWDEAEAVASELPESHEIKDGALLQIASDRRDFERAEKLSRDIAVARAGEYVEALYDRARKISIWGDVRKTEAIRAWEDMEFAAKDMIRMFGQDTRILLRTVRRYLVEAIACKSGDYLSICDVESALRCVEEATDAAISAFTTAKERGYRGDEYEKFKKAAQWIPILCYSKVIPDSDNVLSREPRYKACLLRLEALK